MIVLRSVILAKNVVMFEAHFLASYFEVKDFFCLNLSIGQRTLTSFLTAALSVLKSDFYWELSTSGQHYLREFIEKRVCCGQKTWLEYFKIQVVHIGLIFKNNFPLITLFQTMYYMIQNMYSTITQLICWFFGGVSH